VTRQFASIHASIQDTRRIVSSIQDTRRIVSISSIRASIQDTQRSANRRGSRIDATFS